MAKLADDYEERVRTVPNRVHNVLGFVNEALRLSALHSRLETLRQELRELELERFWTVNEPR